MNVPKPYKIVRRSVAIALGIICIILVAGLGVVLYMSYSPTTTNSVTSLQNQLNQLQTWLDGNKTLLSQTQTWLEGNITDYNSRISDLQNEIASLNSTYNNYVNDHSYTNEQYQHADYLYQYLQNQAYELTYQLNNLTNIVNLANSTVWVDNQVAMQPPGGFGFAYSNWTFSADYAGYVLVNILSADSTIYVELIYSSHGVNYDSQINVGTNGTAIFPVLPSSNILVEVGNKNLVYQSTETVTITYHY